MITRLVAVLLFLALLVFGVVTFAYTDGWEIDTQSGWWFPEMVSTYGEGTDDLFKLIMWMVAVFFVLTEGILIWCMLVFTRAAARRKPSSRTGATSSSCSGPSCRPSSCSSSPSGRWGTGRASSTTASVRPTRRSRASGPPSSTGTSSTRVTDGEFDTEDDFETSFDFVVPVEKTNVVFDLRSRDVIHSFFVPEFRLKQDAMPGMEIPVWFNAEKEGDYDLICAELCGWGHYKMAGRVRVVSKEEYAAFLESAQAKHFDNGSEDRS